MAFENPIRAVKDACEAFLLAEGTTSGGTIATHGYGLRALKEHTKPPRYVWVPSRGREQKEALARGAEEARQLFAFRQHFEVHCWGATDHQTWALVNNVLMALDDATKADLRLENMRWAHPSEAWNQLGELYILECSLLVPTVEFYVNLETLADPSGDYVEPEAYTGALMSTDDLDVDGEIALTVLTED